jgi:hypothetical protein
MVRETTDGVGWRARLSSAAGIVESTLLVSGQYCNAVGKQVIEPTTPVLGRSGVGLLATTAFQIRAATTRDVASWWHRR